MAVGQTSEIADICPLTYDDRFLRRKVLTTAGGHKLLVDLEKTISLNHGDALLLEDGRCVMIEAAAEELFKVTAPPSELTKLAWHIGNRHTPCQIEDTCLVIQRDKVIAHMLEHLGAAVFPIYQPFMPEGGAYGHGRTHAHEHGATHHAD